MQPIFLIMLCFGTILTSLSIIFLGVDENSKIDVDRACAVYPWLVGFGDTFVFSSLFTKLWRVNQVFHAQRFERKVVTIKRVLWPLAIFFTLDLGLLLVATIIDPIVWVRTPVDDNNETVCELFYYDDSNVTVDELFDVDDKIECIGHCKQGEVGEALIGLVHAINFIALVSDWGS